MPAELSFLLSGIVFGLSGGFTPGPLTMLVISQSLRYGVGEGCKIALAPILTDLPIVLITIFIVSQLSDVQVVLGIISILGGMFLVYLGYEGFTFKGAETDFESINPDSFKKGMIANFLNPWNGSFNSVNERTLNKKYKRIDRATALNIILFPLSSL